MNKYRIPRSGSGYSIKCLDLNQGKKRTERSKLVALNLPFTEMYTKTSRVTVTNNWNLGSLFRAGAVHVG